MSKAIKTALMLLCVLLIFVPTFVFASDGSITAPETVPGGGEDPIVPASLEISESSLEPQPDAESPGSPDGKTPGGDEDGTEGGPGNPPSGGEEDTEEETTYEYVEFGSYPQTEIVAQASDSGVYGKAWASEDDYIVDAELYNTLSGLSEDQWDANGDTNVGGSKYRRIKSSDATHLYDSSNEKDENVEANYYSWSDADTYHYFKFEPIRWRVLEEQDGEYFLLSEIIIDDRVYNEKITGTLVWENSSMRSWLNGYDSSANELGTDYTDNNFISTAFTASEQKKIVVSALENADNIENGTEGGNDTNDKIFLLSESEVYGETAADYGFASNADTSSKSRRTGSSTYAKAMGAPTEYEGSYLGSTGWWLRSPGSHPGLFTLVRAAGSVYKGGQHANSQTVRGVRPALRAYLEHIPGDLNGDHEVTVKDLVHLLKYFLDSTVEMAYDGDVNNDGEVSLADVVRLLTHLIDPSVEIY